MGGLVITLAAWLATCAVVALAVFGGFKLLESIERFVAAKLAEDAGCYGADGNWPAVPSDFERLHGKRN